MPICLNAYFSQQKSKVDVPVVHVRMMANAGIELTWDTCALVWMGTMEGIVRKVGGNLQEFQ